VSRSVGGKAPDPPLMAAAPSRTATSQPATGFVSFANGLAATATGHGGSANGEQATAMGVSSAIRVAKMGNGAEKNARGGVCCRPLL
jgi:hypothetical protein